MAVQKKRKNGIARQIEVQIGSIVLTIFVAVAIVALLLVRSVVMSSKETELTLESHAAAWQLSDFFDPYVKMTQQLAVNPEVKKLMMDTGQGDSITQMPGFQTVYDNMVNIEGTDAENILAVWISDVDANVVTQSDGFTSSGDWRLQSVYGMYAHKQEKRF